MMEEWQKVKVINPEAKLVCIDIQPYVSAQAVGRDDILNVGGFSDAVFDVVVQMLNSNGSPDHWVDMIETISL